MHSNMHVDGRLDVSGNVDDKRWQNDGMPDEERPRGDSEGESQGSGGFYGGMEYQEEDLQLDAIGKAFFCGHKRGISGSKFLSKRFTLRGIKERVSIVDNKTILTIVKENKKASPRSREPSLSFQKGQRSRKSTYGKEYENISLRSNSDSPQLGTFRYHKTRESAINHMIYYLNQKSDQDKPDRRESFKKIDLNNVKPQLISSDDRLTFGVNTSNGKHSISPGGQKGMSFGAEALEESKVIGKQVTFITPFGGSMLGSHELSPKQVSDDSEDENAFNEDAMKHLDVDIVELKNLDQSQIAEILVASKQEKMMLSNRISHLDKRVQVLERIVELDEETEINLTGQKELTSILKQKTDLGLEQKQSHWMLSGLAEACTLTKSAIEQVLKKEVSKYTKKTLPFLKDNGHDLIQKLTELLSEVNSDIKDASRRPSLNIIDSIAAFQISKEIDQFKKSKLDIEKDSKVRLSEVPKHSCTVCVPIEPLMISLHLSSIGVERPGFKAVLKKETEVLENLEQPSVVVGQKAVEQIDHSPEADNQTSNKVKNVSDLLKDGKRPHVRFLVENEGADTKQRRDSGSQNIESKDDSERVDEREGPVPVPLESYSATNTLTISRQRFDNDQSNNEKIGTF